MAAINFPSNPTSGQTFVHTVSDGGFQDHDIVYKWDGTSWIAYNDGTHNRILTQSSTINVHSDVDTSTISPQATDVLTWTANSTWEPQEASGGSSTLVGLTDVVFPGTLYDGDTIFWRNSSQTWENVPLFDGDFNSLSNKPNMVNLGDVSYSNVGMPQTNDVLVWTANNVWEPQQQSGGGGGATTLSGLTDTDMTTHAPQAGDVIKWTANNVWEPQKGLSNIYDYTGGVNILGTAAVSGQVDISIGGSLTMSAGTCDFTHSVVNFSGATVAGLDNSDVNLSNIVDSAQGVNITGTAAVSSGVDISIGGSLTCSAGTVDLTHSTVNFSGANVAGLSLGAMSAIAETGTEVQINVRVVTKTTDHRYYGQGSSLGYMFKIDGTDYESPFLDLVPGKTYKFDQSEPTNANHELLFYEDAAKTIPYTAGVVSNGSAGQPGDFTSISVTTSTPAILYYQCVNHAYMGNQLQTKGIASGGSGSPTSAVRQTVAWQNTVAANTDSTSEIALNTTFTNVDSYAIMQVEADTECWIRLYDSSSSRANDSSRDIDTDPTPGSGLLLETVHLEDPGNPGSPPAPIKITPGVYGWNEDVSGSDRSKLHMSIKNLTNSSANIYVTIKFLPLEYS